LNRLLVTGRAVGLEGGPCKVCNYNFGWLVEHPSVLLWADRILVTKSIWDVVQAETYPEPRTLAKSCKVILDLARDRGLVEVRDPSSFLTQELWETVSAQAERDLERIKTAFPDRVDSRSMAETEPTAPGETVIDGFHYCTPHVSTIYASLILAKFWGANSLCDEAALRYLRYKFGIAAFPGQVDRGIVESFAAVFDAYFPNEPLLPHYALQSASACSTCKHQSGCRDDYLRDVERNTIDLLKWREYDEFQEAKAVFEKIVHRQGGASEKLDAAEIANEFDAQKTALARRTRSVFPKVKRWSNVVTLVSIPLMIAGLATDASLLTLGGTGSAGVAQLGKQYVEFLQSKYRWVGFLQSLREGAAGL